MRVDLLDLLDFTTYVQGVWEAYSEAFGEAPREAECDGGERVREGSSRRHALFVLKNADTYRIVH